MDKIRGLPREQKMFAVAGAMVLFIISLFLTWYGGGEVSVGSISIDTSISGFDIDSWWIALVLAIVGGGVFLAEALGVPPPVRWASLGLGALATLLVFFWTLTHLIDGADLGFGAWLALVVSLVGAGLAGLVWSQERS
jgi:hypothetical protein